MATPLALVWDLIARDGASPVFDRVAVAADRSAAATERASKGTAGFGTKAVAALGAIVSIDIAAHMVKSAAEFQKSMLLIQTQAGASASEVKRMSTAVLGLAGQVGTAPEQLATSLYHIESVGFRGAKALDVLRIAAEGAKVGNADLEETTNALTSAVASGIGGVKNISQAMGALNTIVGAGDMHLSDLTAALAGGILVAARNFGVTLTDVGAALATFGDNNVRGADAATQLRMSILALAKPPGPGQTALSAIGIQAGQLAKDMRQGGLIKALNDLNDHMKKAGDTGNKAGEFILNAFGRKAGIGLATLITEIDRFNGKWKVVKDGAASFQSAWTATSQTAAFAFDRIKASAEAVGISIGLGLLPIVSKVASAIGSAIPIAIGIAKDALRPFTVLWDGLAAVMGPLGTAFGAIGHVLAPLKGVLEGVGGAVLGMWAAFKLGNLVAAGLVAIQGAIEKMALSAYTGSARMVGAWQSIGTGASAAAVEVSAAATVIEGEAAATSDAVVVAGDAAKIGWAGLAGPIGIAVLGVLSLVSMFHKSSAASKEATDAAKAYTDALKSGSTSEFVDSIVTQLKDNKVPETINELNKALGSTQYSGVQFVDAIQHGGWQLGTLRDRLQEVVKAGTSFQQVAGGRAGGALVMHLTPAAQAASKALNDLNSQLYGLSKATKQDLLDTKTFRGAAASIDKTTVSTTLGTKAAQQYATMAGLVVDKNGVVAASSKDVNAALDNISGAFNKATQTGDGFLTALNTFSQSAGTANDRAAIIGATLKAANGDALNFAGAMNGASVANHTFFTDVKSNAHAAKQGTKAYLDSLINLKNGTIDYNKAGAAPLIADLQGTQTAALTAAQAMFQHEKRIMGAKGAADAAYKLYVNQTRGSLIDEATKLGLTAGQAKKLADRYFGMPKKVKTLIQQEGANPIVTVLNRIGRLLAHLTGQRWDVNVDTSAAINKINLLAGAVSGLGATLAASQGAKNNSWGGAVAPTNWVGKRAAGGPVRAGMPYIVGEFRPELFVPSTNGTILPKLPGGDSGQVVAELRRNTAAVQQLAGQFADALNGTARQANQRARTMPAGRAW